MHSDADADNTLDTHYQGGRASFASLPYSPALYLSSRRVADKVMYIGQQSRDRTSAFS